jgi:hypothetical protein
MEPGDKRLQAAAFLPRQPSQPVLRLAKEAAFDRLPAGLPDIEDLAASRLTDEIQGIPCLQDKRINGLPEQLDLAGRLAPEVQRSLHPNTLP